MEDEFKKLLLRNSLNLLNEIPLACNLVVDKKGSWNIRDFEKVWENKAFEALFSKDPHKSFIERIELNKLSKEEM